MRTESRVFYLAAGFLFLVAGGYAWMTDQLVEVLDWAGTVALTLAGGLCAMIGLYFGFVANRIEPRPEDRGDADISEGAGDVGFFPPGSYWPIAIAGGATIAGLGLSIFQLWLLAAGLVAVLLAVCGLTFEFYTGTRRGLD